MGRKMERQTERQIKRLTGREIERGKETRNERDKQTKINCCREKNTKREKQSGKSERM